MALNIGLDFDGVYVNTHVVKVDVAKEKFGVVVSPENFRRDFIVKNGILALDEYVLVGREAMNGSHPIPLVADSSLYLEILMREKHSIRFITSRTEELLETAKAILRENRFDLLIQGTGYGLSKVTACEGLDLYVDDDLEKLLPLVGKVRHLLLFSWPWNAHEKEPKGIERISSWWEIYNYIRYET